ncbi:chromate transporter [Diplocloster modestus]|uniref:Chromate transporter n=1 Tax=Diplocloster modestus TaxID=2850322 RepID=A0ABS6KEW9_9FIRM|nr:chromate transporter [Diplocloster modestus]MBU9729063.1 chromate transporter [Diplocloster modestus]
MKELIELFCTFAQIGALTFGGGLAMLPMLRHELVEKKEWVTEDELLDYYAIGQCTPGIIAVNTATFVGYKRKGVWGGVMATLGMVFPSLVIISLVASVLMNFMENTYVAHALAGIRAVVCALMLGTVLTLARKSMVDWICYLVFFGTLLLALFSPVPVVLLVVLAAGIGVGVKRFREKRRTNS